MTWRRSASATRVWPVMDDSPTIQWLPVIYQPSTRGVRLSELPLLTVVGYARQFSYEHW